MTRMWPAIGLAGFLVLAGSVIGEPPEQPKTIDVRPSDPAYRLVGQFGFPFGETFRVEGFIAGSTNRKGDSGQTMLVVQRVNEKPSQQVMLAPIGPYFGSWGDEPVPKVRAGETYSLEVYETGGYRGIPGAVLAKAPPIQARGFGFESGLAVFGGVKRDRIVDLPKDFVGKEAAFEGIARKGASGAIVEGEGWTLALDGEAWTAEFEGKRVIVRGAVREETPGAFEMAPLKEGGRQLARIEDLVGRRAAIRVHTWNMNNVPTCSYRGVKMSVAFAHEGAAKGWPHGEDAFVTGDVVRDGDGYRIENVEWKPTEMLLPETGMYEKAQAEKTR